MIRKTAAEGSPRILKTRPFARFAEREGIGDHALVDAVERAERGLVDADLGGGVLKQRIARPGQGRSGGFRSILLFRRGSLAVFVYGFAKNVRSNIDPDELRAFRKLAGEILRFGDSEISAACANGTLVEVSTNDQKLPK
jgi:hypothetical protein